MHFWWQEKNYVKCNFLDLVFFNLHWKFYLEIGFVYIFFHLWHLAMKYIIDYNMFLKNKYKYLQIVDMEMVSMDLIYTLEILLRQIVLLKLKPRSQQQMEPQLMLFAKIIYVDVGLNTIWHLGVIHTTMNHACSLRVSRAFWIAFNTRQCVFSPH